MFRRIFSFSGLLLLSGAVFFVTPGSGWAGGVHFGGAHFGGAHIGAAHFGGYHGGYHSGYGGYHPYYGYHDYYHPSYGYGYYPYYGGYPYLWSGLATDPGYGGDYAQVAPTYLDDTTSVSPPATGYQSYYAPATRTDQPDGIAHITVNVPPDAKVWFDDTPMTATGSIRRFDSPGLTPGSRYSYDIKASWKENGHEVTQAQRVEVSDGARVNVRFPAPPKTTGQASDATHG